MSVAADFLLPVGHPRVNTRIASPSGASAGVGFAVPVNTVSRVVPQIIETGEYTPPQLGIRMDDGRPACW